MAQENKFPWPPERQEPYSVFAKRVADLREAARLRIIEKQQKVKERVDRSRRVTQELRVGELVLVKRNLTKKGKTKKFLPKFVGPYQVVKKVCETTYLVEDLPARRKQTKRFNAHVCQIRHFHAREDVEWEQGDDSEKEEESSDTEEEGEGINDTEEPEENLPSVAATETATIGAESSFAAVYPDKSNKIAFIVIHIPPCTFRTRMGAGMIVEDLHRHVALTNYAPGRAPPDGADCEGDNGEGLGEHQNHWDLFDDINDRILPLPEIHLIGAATIGAESSFAAVYPDKSNKIAFIVIHIPPYSEEDTRKSSKTLVILTTYYMGIPIILDDSEEEEESSDTEEEGEGINDTEEPEENLPSVAATETVGEEQQPVQPREPERTRAGRHTRAPRWHNEYERH
ncbi:hypothetical protein DAPPUDRAFT_118259 [Daphnia pulex]|uniref:Uncharacterized protein n=1 Tax=Daphnia pulex TaxID=6669 RepID=E9HV74_DAPPU|nr:hypothetical protein DAPPUDRAFT_118259 [Daphnia pulex]|eukprot:EFX64357.1 hypothetical protein DAPPUDRAFT_118259 [Daphnia pulex]